MIRALLALAFVFAIPSSVKAADCTVLATGVSFGTYVPTSTSPTDNTGLVTVTCNAAAQLVQYSIALNAGQNSSGNFSNRQMSSGGSFLSYQIYSNSSRTTVWGDGTGGTSTVSDSYFCVLCVGQVRTYTTYGRLPGRQFSAAPGLPSSPIVILVTFN